MNFKRIAKKLHSTRNFFLKLRNIDHATSQPVADHVMAKTVLKQGTIDKYTNAREFKKNGALSVTIQHALKRISAVLHPWNPESWTEKKG